MVSELMGFELDGCSRCAPPSSCTFPFPYCVALSIAVSGSHSLIPALSPSCLKTSVWMFSFFSIFLILPNLVAFLLPLLSPDPDSFPLDQLNLQCLCETQPLARMLPALTPCSLSVGCLLLCSESITLILHLLILSPVS